MGLGSAKRQKHLEHGSLPDLRVRDQASPMFLHDPVADGKTEPCALARELRRVERLEDLRQILPGNPHPGVLECAAIGIDDPISGQTVQLFVVKRDPALDEDALMQHCRENLTAYKRPKSIVFREDLPKSNVGKILRRELREET